MIFTMKTDVVLVFVLLACGTATIAQTTSVEPCPARPINVPKRPCDEAQRVPAGAGPTAQTTTGEGRIVTPTGSGGAEVASFHRQIERDEADMFRVEWTCADPAAEVRVAARLGGYTKLAAVHCR